MPEVTAPLDSSVLLRFSSVFEPVCSGFLSLVERVLTSEVTQLNQTEPNWDSESGCCKGGDASELLLAWEFGGGAVLAERGEGSKALALLGKSRTADGTASSQRTEWRNICIFFSQDILGTLRKTQQDRNRGMAKVFQLHTWRH